MMIVVALESLHLNQHKEIHEFVNVWQPTDGLQMQNKINSHHQ